MSAPRGSASRRGGSTSRCIWHQQGEADVRRAGRAASSCEEPFYVGIGVCAHNTDVTERRFSRTSNLPAPLPAARAGRCLYSTLETQAIASTDRRVVHVTPARIEAPNWLRDGQVADLQQRRAGFIGSRGRRAARGRSTPASPPDATTTTASRPTGSCWRSATSRREQASRLIYTLPVAGGTPRLVTPTGPSYWHGWSPDGKTLAFCGERDGEFDIYTDPRRGRQRDAG